MLRLDNIQYMWKTVSNLESAGIIEQIRAENEDYEIIKNFWREEHPTSPKTPKMFTLRKDFAEIIDAYKDAITKQFFSVHELSMIAARKRRWQDFSSQVKKQKQFLVNRKAVSAGSCFVCDKIIKKNDVLGMDYHSYAKGFVCRTCQAKATKKQIRKWIS